MRLDITGCGLIGMPDIVLHENAVQAVITRPPPMWLNYSPSSIGDDLSDANAFVPKTPRKLVPLSVRAGDFNEHGSLYPGRSNALVRTLAS
jgi:hypothetical protein